MCCGTRFLAQGGRRAAFTLIELLVVIVIIAVLIAILLPALSSAQRSARQTVGLANLRSCGQAQMAYARDSNDSFVNPFDAKNQQLLGIQWYEFAYQNSTGSGPPVGYGYQDPEYTTELFSVTWASVVVQYLSATNTTSSAIVSPNDTTAVQRQRQRMQTFQNGNDGLLFDTTFWASPTLWLQPSVFASASRVPVTPSDVQMWRRNRFDDVITPNAKVMVFERFDFSRATRSKRGGGREKFSPTFNNFEGTTRFVTCDGSVGQQDNDRLRRAIQPSATNQAQRAMFSPAGDWDVPDVALAVGFVFALRLEKDGLENGDGSASGPSQSVNMFPAFYWGTHQGVQGRDVIR